MTPPEAFEPIGKRAECKPLPSTPEEAYLPPRVTSHDPDHDVPGTPEDAKIVDYEKFKGQEASS